MQTHAFGRRGRRRRLNSLAVSPSSRCRSCYNPRCELPGEHDAADLDGAAPVGLADTACGLNNSPIAVKLDDGAALEEPKES
jgi:hypothetical protein